MTSILDYFRGVGRISARGGRHAVKGFTYTGKAAIGPKSPSGKRLHKNQKRL